MFTNLRSTLIAIIIGTVVPLGSSGPVVADGHEELGPAIARVNVCQPTGDRTRPWVLVPMSPEEAREYLRRGGMAYVSSESECGMARQLDDGSFGFIPLNGSASGFDRRAIPVEMEPIPDLPAGGGQGSVPGTDEWRRAIPVEVVPMDEVGGQDAPTGGGQGSVPEIGAERRAIPVDTEPLPGVARAEAGPGTGGDHQPAEAAVQPDGPPPDGVLDTIPATASPVVGAATGPAPTVDSATGPLAPDAGSETDAAGGADIGAAAPTRAPRMPLSLPSTGESTTAPSTLWAGAMAVAAGYYFRRKRRRW